MNLLQPRAREAPEVLPPVEHVVDVELTHPEKALFDHRLESAKQAYPADPYMAIQEGAGLAVALRGSVRTGVYCCSPGAF